MVKIGVSMMFTYIFYMFTYTFENYLNFGGNLLHKLLLPYPKNGLHKKNKK